MPSVRGPSRGRYANTLRGATRTSILPTTKRGPRFDHGRTTREAPTLEIAAMALESVQVHQAALIFLPLWAVPVLIVLAVAIGVFQKFRDRGR